MHNSPLNSSCPFGRHFNLKLSHSTFQVLVKTISGFHDNRDNPATFDASKSYLWLSCKEHKVRCCKRKLLAFLERWVLCKAPKTELFTIERALDVLSSLDEYFAL